MPLASSRQTAGLGYVTILRLFSGAAESVSLCSKVKLILSKKRLWSATKVLKMHWIKIKVILCSEYFFLGAHMNVNWLLNSASLLLSECILFAQTVELEFSQGHPSTPTSSSRSTSLTPTGQKQPLLFLLLRVWNDLGLSVHGELETKLFNACCQHSGVAKTPQRARHPPSFSALTFEMQVWCLVLGWNSCSISCQSCSLTTSLSA